MKIRLLLLLFGLGLWCCNKDTMSNPKPEPGVYVGGRGHNQTTSLAEYWVNGTAVELDRGENYAVNSIAINGADIYAAGGDGYAAKYWKNEIAVILTVGTQFAWASSVTVSGKDVYVAGYEGNVAKYWKNGMAVNLAENAIATSIVISGTDVYVTGIVNRFATYWKNGIAVNLTDGTENAFANAIAISGTDVYVAGSEATDPDLHLPKAKYWKNGIAVNLWDSTQSNSSATATSIS